MKKKNIYIDLEQMDQAIERLTVIKKLMEDIKNLQKDMPLNPMPNPHTPVTPLPYVPPSPTTVPQWVPNPIKITCVEGEC